MHATASEAVEYPAEPSVLRIRQFQIAGRQFLSDEREFPASDPGTGTRHLAVAARQALIEYQNLFEQIKAGYDPSSGSSNREAYRSALDTAILLLDDLAAGRLVVERGAAGKHRYQGGVAFV